MDRRKFGLGLLALGGTACIPAVALSLADKDNNKLQDFVDILQYSKDNHPFHSVYFNAYDIAELFDSEIKYTKDGIMYVNVDESDKDVKRLFNYEFGFCKGVPEGWAQITLQNDEFERMQKLQILHIIKHSSEIRESLYSFGNEFLIDVNTGAKLNGYFI